MKISIIIPVYNVEKYLQQCIDSVIIQQFKDLEIILVDDGSTDNSGRLCDLISSKDHRVKVIHKENGGLSDARNTGIVASTGDYIMFVDSDDWITDNCIEDIVNIIYQNPNIDIISGRFISYYQYEDKYIDDKFIFNEEKTDTMTGQQALKYIFGDIYRQLWSACSAIYRRSLIVENNLFFQKGIVSEDLECVPKIYLNAKSVKFYNKSFYIYRRDREGSIINSVSKKKFVDTYNVINKWIDYLSYNKLDKDFVDSFYAQLGEVVAIYMVSIWSLNKKDRKEVLNKYNKIAFLLKNTRNKSSVLKTFLVEIIGFKITCYICWMKVKFKSSVKVIHEQRLFYSIFKNK